MQLPGIPITASPFAMQEPADTGTTGADSTGSASDSNSATITANDFLQLLVTEMQNQDPTNTTDPNEYIDQLVQVNSLEQLISINNTLSGLGSSGTSPSAGIVSGTSTAEGTSQGLLPGPATAGAAPAQGNLSSGDTGPAASRIARALSEAGNTLAPGSSSSPLGSTIGALAKRAQQARTSLSNPAH